MNDMHCDIYDWSLSRLPMMLDTETVNNSFDLLVAEEIPNRLFYVGSVRMSFQNS
jgi:hypothetical protein